jgi:hypothetical protein
VSSFESLSKSLLAWADRETDNKAPVQIAVTTTAVRVNLEIRIVFPLELVIFLFLKQSSCVPKRFSM